MLQGSNKKKNMDVKNQVNKTTRKAIGLFDTPQISVFKKKMRMGLVFTMKGVRIRTLRIKKYVFCRMDNNGHIIAWYMWENGSIDIKSNVGNKDGIKSNMKKVDKIILKNAVFWLFDFIFARSSSSVLMNFETFLSLS